MRGSPTRTSTWSAAWVLPLAAADQEGEGWTSFFEQEEEAALVADVATDPNGEVLEEATGRVFEIFVAVPDGQGGQHLAKGGIFSYYEFPWPMSDRLTDEAWQAFHDRALRFDLVILDHTYGPEEEGGDVTPMTYTQSQWKGFFDRNKHKRKKDVWTEMFTPAELLDIKTYLINHASDSEQPETCG